MFLRKQHHKNNLSDEEAKTLSAALHATSSLTRISLGDNNITDDGVTALATALRNNTAVTEIVFAVIR